MAMVPYSNPAGQNQTSPSAVAGGPKAVGTVPALPGSSAAGTSPFHMLPMGSTATGEPQSATVPQSPGSLYDTSTSPGYGGQSNIEKQLIDIYGKGVGGMLNSLLAGMGGADSQIFQQFLASMQPQLAKSKADFMQTEGAAGVSANSTVAAHGLADIQSQFNATAAGENAQLMDQQLQDTLNVLMGVRGDASKEVATSGMDVFAHVMQNLASVGGDVFKAAGEAGGFGALF